MTLRTVGNPIIAGIDLASLTIGTYGICMIIWKTPLPEYFIEAGHWQFLTNLSLAYSLMLFFIGFIAHVTRSTWLYTIKNTLHPIGLALECVVTVIYWPLRLFFLSLLTEDPGSFKLPLTIDLAIHLMPMVSLLIDYLVFMPQWTIKTSTALSIVVALTVLYWYLLEFLVDIENGAKYPYAFLNGDKSHRMVAFAVVGLVAFVQFLFLRKIYDWIVITTQEIEAAIDGTLHEKDE